MDLIQKFNQADKALERMTAQAEKEIVKAYSQSLKKIRGQLSEVYAKYSVGDGLNYSDMAKYNRLAGLEKEVREELSSLTGKTAKTLNRSLVDIYSESYYRTAFAIETTAQAKLGYSLLNKNTIQRAIENPLTKLALQRNATNVKTNIAQQITQGLIQGEGYPKMAKRVKEALESNTNNALRIARTEAHRSQQAGRLDSGEHAADKGINMVKVWVSALDSRTRDAHQDLDGVKVGVDEDFVSNTGGRGQAPGQMGTAEDDINCRCSMRFEIVGYEPEVRRARGEGVIPYTTYSEWKENRID